MANKKKKDKTMAEVSAGYEDFMKREETANKSGKKLFEKTLK